MLRLLIQNILNIYLKKDSLAGKKILTIFSFERIDIISIFGTDSHDKNYTYKMLPNLCRSKSEFEINLPDFE